MENVYALAIHGGAGAKPNRDYSKVEQHLTELIKIGEQHLKNKQPALDIVEHIVCEMENSGLYVAGKGSAKNQAGYVELDASIMDGYTHKAGSVAAIKNIINPISAARKVMEDTKHVMLVGNGANEFAKIKKLAKVENPETYYTRAVGIKKQDENELSHGTVGAVALDLNGHLAAATSTGGVFGKMEGRVGDTPIISVGTWADSHIAASCTGLGEYFILAGGARDISARVKYGGTSLQNASTAMLDEVANLGGDGGVIVVSNKGEIAMPFNSKGMKRASVSSNTPLYVAIF